MGEHGSMSQMCSSLWEKIRASKAGSAAVADELLIGQAVALSTIFNECMRRAALNMGESPEMMERYMRLGLKATSRSEEHTSELQSLMRISYAVFCLKKK